MEINYNQNIKKKIIPDEWKSDIDNILNEQLFNANRYYAENMPSLNEKVMKFAQLNSTDFFKILKKQ